VTQRFWAELYDLHNKTHTALCYKKLNITRHGALFKRPNKKQDKLRNKQKAGPTRWRMNVNTERMLLVMAQTRRKHSVRIVWFQFGDSSPRTCVELGSTDKTNTARRYRRKSAVGRRKGLMICYTLATYRRGSTVAQVVRHSSNMPSRLLIILIYLQSVLVHSASCVKTYTLTCRRVFISTPL
jgi:hypothetical protein